MLRALLEADARHSLEEVRENLQIERSEHAWSRFEEYAAAVSVARRHDATQGASRTYMSGELLRSWKLDGKLWSERWRTYTWYNTQSQDTPRDRWSIEWRVVFQLSGYVRLFLPREQSNHRLLEYARPYFMVFSKTSREVVCRS